MDYNEFGLPNFSTPDLSDDDRAAVQQGIADTLLRSPSFGFVSGIGSGMSGLGDAYDAFMRQAPSALQNVFPGLAVLKGLHDYRDRLPSWMNPANNLRSAGEPVKDWANTFRVPEERRNFGTDVGEAMGQIGSQALISVIPGVGPVAGPAMMFGQGVDQMKGVVKPGSEGTFAGDSALLAGGVVTAISEKLGLDALLHRVPPAVKNRILRGIADKVLAGGIEAAEEYAEGVGQRLVANLITGSEHDVLGTDGHEESVAGTAGALARSMVPGRGRGALSTQPRSTANDTNLTDMLGEMSLTAGTPTNRPPGGPGDAPEGGPVGALSQTGTTPTLEQQAPAPVEPPPVQTNQWSDNWLADIGLEPPTLNEVGLHSNVLESMRLDPKLQQKKMPLQQWQTLIDKNTSGTEKAFIDWDSLAEKADARGQVSREDVIAAVQEAIPEIRRATMWHEGRAGDNRAAEVIRRAPTPEDPSTYAVASSRLDENGMPQQVILATGDDPVALNRDILAGKFENTRMGRGTSWMDYSNQRHNPDIMSDYAEHAVYMPESQLHGEPKGGFSPVHYSGGNPFGDYVPNHIMFRRGSSYDIPEVPGRRGTNLTEAQADLAQGIRTKSKALVNEWLRDERAAGREPTKEEQDAKEESFVDELTPKMKPNASQKKKIEAAITKFKEENGRDPTQAEQRSIERSFLSRMPYADDANAWQMMAIKDLIARAAAGNHPEVSLSPGVEQSRRWAGAHTFDALKLLPNDFSARLQIDTINGPMGLGVSIPEAPSQDAMIRYLGRPLASYLRDTLRNQAAPDVEEKRKELQRGYDEQYDRDMQEYLQRVEQNRADLDAFNQRRAEWNARPEWQVEEIEVPPEEGRFEVRNIADDDEVPSGEVMEEEQTDFDAEPDEQGNYPTITVYNAYGPDGEYLGEFRERSQAESEVEDAEANYERPERWVVWDTDADEQVSMTYNDQARAERALRNEIGYRTETEYRVTDPNDPEHTHQSESWRDVTNYVDERNGRIAGRDYSDATNDYPPYLGDEPQRRYVSDRELAHRPQPIEMSKQDLIDKGFMDPNVGSLTTGSGFMNVYDRSHVNLTEKVIKALQQDSKKRLEHAKREAKRLKRELTPEQIAELTFTGNKVAKHGREFPIKDTGNNSVYDIMRGSGKTYDELKRIMNDNSQEYWELADKFGRTHGHHKLTFSDQDLAYIRKWGMPMQRGGQVRGYAQGGMVAPTWDYQTPDVPAQPSNINLKRGGALRRYFDDGGMVPGGEFIHGFDPNEDAMRANAGAKSRKAAEEMMGKLQSAGQESSGGGGGGGDIFGTLLNVGMKIAPMFLARGGHVPGYAKGGAAHDLLGTAGSLLGNLIPIPVLGSMIGKFAGHSLGNLIEGNTGEIGDDAARDFTFGVADPDHEGGFNPMGMIGAGKAGASAFADAPSIGFAFGGPVHGRLGGDGDDDYMLDFAPEYAPSHNYEHPNNRSPREYAPRDLFEIPRERFDRRDFEDRPRYLDRPREHFGDMPRPAPEGGVILRGGRPPERFARGGSVDDEMLNYGVMFYDEGGQVGDVMGERRLTRSPEERYALRQQRVGESNQRINALKDSIKEYGAGRYWGDFAKALPYGVATGLTEIPGNVIGYPGTKLEEAGYHTFLPTQEGIEHFRESFKPEGHPVAIEAGTQIGSLLPAAFGVSGLTPAIRGAGMVSRMPAHNAATRAGTRLAGRTEKGLEEYDNYLTGRDMLGAGYAASNYNVAGGYARGGALRRAGR